MNDLLSNTWLWVILAIIFAIIAVIVYHTSRGYTGWYWLFIVLTVISLILAFLAYSKNRTGGVPVLNGTTASRTQMNGNLRSPRQNMY